MLPAPEDPTLGPRIRARRRRPSDPHRTGSAPDRDAPDEPAARALAVVELARAGQFDEIRELFTPGLRPMVTAAGLRAAWEAELAERGQLTSVGAPTSDPADGAMITVQVPVTFERGRQTLAVYLTRDGQLAGIQLAPPGDGRARRAVGTARLRGPCRASMRTT